MSAVAIPLIIGGLWVFVSALVAIGLGQAIRRVPTQVEGEVPRAN